MDFLYLRGRTVRYIHLPGTLDPAAAIEAHRRTAVEALATHRRYGRGCVQERGCGQRWSKGSLTVRGQKQFENI